MKPKKEAYIGVCINCGSDGEIDKVTELCNYCKELFKNEDDDYDENELVE